MTRVVECSLEMDPSSYCELCGRQWAGVTAVLSNSSILLACHFCADLVVTRIINLCRSQEDVNIDEYLGVEIRYE
jgi:ribosome-binding protein aMBF1 (putative translation factor)